MGASRWGLGVVWWHEETTPAIWTTKSGNLEPRRLPNAGARRVDRPIRYVLRTGCSWRMLPHDLPPWRIVFHYFRTWRKDRTWQRANDALLSNLRQSQGRAASPSAAVIDSQSVKTTEKGGREVTTRASG